MTERKRLRGDERREQILQATMTLFIDRGFEGVTMADIAEATGMSRPNIYTYFPSPAAVLDQLLDDALEAATADLLPLMASGVVPDFAALLSTLVQHRHLLLLMHCGGGPQLRSRREQFDDALIGALVERLSSERVQRRPELVPLVTALLSGLIYECVVRERPSCDPAQLGHSINAFVRGGVQAVLAQEDPRPGPERLP
ncbi:transcriptional regulator, TetR family [Deinococcus reticulitermitis]|uniref:Transcriptional regulator, TetR family n=1 Tax=Deinococcus reticulitermitis TaxID=856736 RepID=A0A1H6S9G6_9DEIO|nr:TetR/AcrR family transcriptional regulator [Deinococcus reticulitermitis]SEI60072.1 transcriptional regulator, TetR family [Deinococcus reticulitermitis]